MLCLILIAGGLLIMMGQHDRSESLFYYFRLEYQVPETHLLRLIDKHISFAFVRERLRRTYSETGRPSIDPELLLRILLIGYLYGITSERKLVEELRMHLAWRWFTGLGFDQEIPHHSTFSKNRHGRFQESKLFEDLFQPIVKQCVEVGLVQGKHLSSMAVSWGPTPVTFEEGTSAAWLHDLLKPHVSRLVVCDPRKNALLKDGSKSDRIDARKLAELLRGNQLHPVYHGEHGVRTLKELARSYLTLTQDVSRVMTRIKALYRSWAIPCSGTTVYAPRYRAEWLAKIPQPGVRLRAERFYQQLDLLQPVRQEARRDMLSESRKHRAVKLLRQIPAIGPIRAAMLLE